MSRRFRRYVRASAPLVLLVVIAAACASDGFPEDYDEQIDDETGLSNVEANWLEGCEVGLSEDLADNANAVCACSYRRIKDEIPFEEFVDVNNELKNDPEKLVESALDPTSTQSQLVEIVKGCIASS